ncbi:hypothetical protein FQN50_009368 [Emmonsiellopsis sp. PD_5]|nr:hypothetical protein FQN50_009368 [Emmonsiellopsis sp. PD_5]
MESSPIFYTSTTFTCKPHEFSRIIEITPIIRLSLIRRLQIGPLCQAEPCGLWFNYNPYSIPHWLDDKAIDVMRRMTSLRDLQIVVCWGEGHSYGVAKIRPSLYNMCDFALAIRGLDWVDGQLVFPRYMGAVLEGVLGVEREKIFEAEILAAPAPTSLQSLEGVDMAFKKAEKLLGVRLRDMMEVEGEERGGSVIDSEALLLVLSEHYGKGPPGFNIYTR